eukprot:g16830.t1
MSWAKEGTLIMISALLAVSVLRCFAFKDYFGAARSVAGVFTGSLVLRYPRPWTLLVHSAMCALGWLFDVGPWLLDFQSSSALGSSHTLAFLVLLGPFCWMLGLRVNLKLYIQMSVKEEELPLRSQRTNSMEASGPFATLFSWESDAK